MVRDDKIKDFNSIIWGTGGSGGADSKGRDPRRNFTVSQQKEILAQQVVRECNSSCQTGSGTPR